MRDSLTQQPLPFASVFLANTTLGATTSEQGRFSFPHVPAGTYDLVVSYVGYRLSKQTITVGLQPQELALRLSPSANRLGEVVVHARPTRPADYQRFVELFLGSTTFSQQCRIRNPKAVRMDYDATKQELTASADEFVQVDNQALGYRLTFPASTACAGRCCTRPAPPFLARPIRIRYDAGAPCRPLLSCSTPPPGPPTACGVLRPIALAICTLPMSCKWLTLVKAPTRAMAS